MSLSPSTTDRAERDRLRRRRAAAQRSRDRHQATYIAIAPGTAVPIAPLLIRAAATRGGAR